MLTVKLLQNGQSQTVRLPKEFSFEGVKEVFVKKINDTVILIPKKNENNNKWDKFFENLNNFTDDFMTVRVQPDQKREDIF